MIIPTDLFLEILLIYQQECQEMLKQVQHDDNWYFDLTLSPSPKVREVMHKQRLMNKVQNVQECDATMMPEVLLPGP